MAATAGSSSAAGGTIKSQISAGVIGPYDQVPNTSATTVETNLHSAGASVGLLELDWSQAEPSNGVFNDTYLNSMKSQGLQMASSGLGVVLNTGLATAPSWLLAMSGARYVDQFGNIYTGSTEPNLVFNTALRSDAQAYLNHVFSVLGTTGFFFVRVGGGHWGELTYPPQLTNSNGTIKNDYWAFDVNAKKSDPVPGYVPGSGPAAQAGTFLTWYLQSLIGYQNWQIQALRTAGYTGYAAVLYPSYGMRSGDAAAAAAKNLSDSTSPEINGEVQGGHDALDQVPALTDTNTVVYGTWGEIPQITDFLTGLANTKGLPTAAEAAGEDSKAQLETGFREAVKDHLAAYFVVRANDLYCTTKTTGSCVSTDPSKAKLASIADLQAVLNETP